MKTLLTLIAMLSLLSFLLKGSFHPRWGVALAAFALALVAGLSVPWLIRQSPAAFTAWTSSPRHLLDGAVCVVLEVLIMAAFCFSRVAGCWRILRFYPGLLAFPAVVWTWAQVLYARPGVNFSLLAWLAAAFTLAVAWGGPVLLRRLLPDESSRLEALFLINLFLLLLTVAATGAITF